MQVRNVTAIAALLTAAAVTPAPAININLTSATSASHGSGNTRASNATTLSLGLGGNTGSGIGASLGLDAVIDATAGGDTAALASTSASAAATGSVAADAWGNVGVVVNLIESSDWAANSFSSLAVTQAAAIAVNDAANADARATLDAALGVYASDIGELRVALAANISLSAWLDAQGIDISSVIAADVTAAGSLNLYTD